MSEGYEFRLYGYASIFRIMAFEVTSHSYILEVAMNI